MSICESFRRFTSALVVLVTCALSETRADLIPPGNKSVSHRLIFQDSELLRDHRVIAMPVRGFGGHEEIEAGKPIPFSTKYGTRLYVVPDDYEPPGKMMRKDLPNFPSCDVPVSSITYVPVFSPVASIRTTLELADVSDDSITVTVVDHVELDRTGQPASLLRSALPLFAISAAGIAGCFVLWWRKTGAVTKGSGTQNETTTGEASPAESP